MKGEVYNGDRNVPVTFGRYVGPAAVMQREGFREVAYRGQAPAPRAFPIDGAIAGEPAIAIESRASSVKGVAVLIVPD